MLWLGPVFIKRHRVRKRVLIGLAATIVLFAVPPAWPQSEGPDAPSHDNVLETSSIRESFSRWMRPQTAQAAPRTVYRQHRVRAVKTRPAVEAAVPIPAPRPATPAWPNAQESAGTGSIVPVELKTVRELAEPEAEIPIVHENELSDLDIAAQPLAVPSQLAQSETMAGTDGRAADDDADFHGNRFAAFAENVRAMGNASWLESLLLAMAGATGAVAAMRIFVGPRSR